MDLQEYVPTPPPQVRPGFDLSGWTDPLFALPVLAAFVVLLALAILVVVVAVIASRGPQRPRPPIESTS